MKAGSAWPWLTRRCATEASYPRHDRTVVPLLADMLCRVESISDYIEQYGSVRCARLQENVMRHEDRLPRRALKLVVELVLMLRSRAALGVD